MLHGAAKMQEGRERIRELPQQVCPLEANLEARLCRGDSRQIFAVRIEDDQSIAGHKGRHICHIVNCVESKAETPCNSINWQFSISTTPEAYYHVVIVPCTADWNCRNNGVACTPWSQEQWSRMHFTPKAYHHRMHDGSTRGLQGMPVAAGLSSLLSWPMREMW